MEHNKLYSQILNAILLVTVFLAFSISWAFAWWWPTNYFWRTYDNATNTNVSDVWVNQYGCWYGQLGGFWFGYGYGYGGSNSKFEGRQISLYPCNVNGHNFGGSGSSSSSSSSGSGGGGGSGSSSSSSSGGGGGGGGGGWSSSSSSGGHIPLVTPSGTGSSHNTNTGAVTEDSHTPSSTESNQGGTGTTDGVGGTYTPETYADEPKSATCGTSNVIFTDIGGHPLAPYIIDLEKRSGLHGLEVVNKIFGPDRQATRSEFLKMIIRALCIDYWTASGTLDTFNDVWVEEWQAKIINTGIRLGWISTDNPSFRPNEPISRAEALKLILNAAWVVVGTPTSSSFTDVPLDSWMVRYTERAKNLGIVHGQEINGLLYFRPADNITRAESAKIIMKTLFPS